MLKRTLTQHALKCESARCLAHRLDLVFLGGGSKFSLTNLQLSQSESFMSKPRSDQRGRLLLGEEHRDGGRRKEAGLLASSSTIPSPSTPTGEWLLPLFSSLFLSSTPSPSLVSPLSRARVLRFFPLESQSRLLRGSGLDDGDRESLSDDGGRTFSMGMGTGLAI